MRTRIASIPARRTWLPILPSLAVGALLAARLSGAETPPVAVFSEVGIPHACGIQIKNNDCTPAALNEIRAAGFGFVRKGFVWESVETQKGVYDFSFYDRVVEEASKNGLHILGTIVFGNKLYGPVSESSGRKGYAGFAAELVRRYKDRNIVWEIWNEPNTKTFWGKHGKGNSEQFAAEYVALVKESVPAMRKADPNCVVLAGSTSCLWSESYQWTEACFAQHIFDAGISGWSVHPYNFKCPEAYLDAYDHVRKIATQLGLAKDFPMVNSERGFPLKATEGWAGGTPNLTPQYQAWHLVRQYLVDMLCDVKLTVWYEWSGTEFGIHREKDSRPAYLAAKTMFEQLEGFTLVKRLPSESAADFELLFENKSGKQKLVVWTAPPQFNQSPDNAVEHSVELPVGSGPMDDCDLFGNKSSLKAADGKIRVTLSGSPQYITLNGNRMLTDAKP